VAERNERRSNEGQVGGTKRGNKEKRAQVQESGAESGGEKRGAGRRLETEGQKKPNKGKVLALEGYSHTACKGGL